VLTSYARRVLKINENRLTARRYSSGPPPGVGDLWLCSSPLRQYVLSSPGLCVSVCPQDRWLSTKACARDDSLEVVTLLNFGVGAIPDVDRGTRIDRASSVTAAHRLLSHQIQ